MSDTLESNIHAFHGHGDMCLENGRMKRKLHEHSETRLWLGDGLPKARSAFHLEREDAAGSACFPILLLSDLSTVATAHCCRLLLLASFHYFRA